MEQDMSLPVPREKELQTVAQRLYMKDMMNSCGTKKLYFASGDWHLNGEVYIFSADGKVHIDNTAELRFGKHPGMGGMSKVTLYTYYKSGYINDDKHWVDNVHFAADSQTITGNTHARTIVFKIYPYQVARLLRFTRAFGTTRTLDALVGVHINNTKKGE